MENITYRCPACDVKYKKSGYCPACHSRLRPEIINLNKLVTDIDKNYNADLTSEDCNILNTINTELINNNIECAISKCDSIDNNTLNKTLKSHLELYDDLPSDKTAYGISFNIKLAMVSIPAMLIAAIISCFTENMTIACMAWSFAGISAGCAIREFRRGIYFRKSKICKSVLRALLYSRIELMLINQPDMK